jgi:hypothetical protein
MQQQDNGRNIMVQGRIVWTVGDLFKGDLATQYGTKTPKLNKQGQQYREYGFGLAVPKEVLGQMGPGQPGEIWAAIHEVAYTLYPSRQIPANFHMKYKDGDTGTNQDGTPVNTKEGYPGHVVFALKTSAAAPKFFRWENGQNIQVNEGIKCGDYVQVQVNIKAHAGTNAGLYLNPMAVRFLVYGKEIINAPSGDTLFGTAAPAMPAGASSTPIGPVGMIVPQGMPAPQQQFAPPPVTAQPAQPHFGVLPTPFQPAQQPVPGPIAAPQYAPPPVAAQPAQSQYPGMPPLPGSFQQ